MWWTKKLILQQKALMIFFRRRGEPRGHQDKDHPHPTIGPVRTVTDKNRDGITKIGIGEITVIEGMKRTHPKPHRIDQGLHHPIQGKMIHEIGLQTIDQGQTIEDDLLQTVVATVEVVAGLITIDPKAHTRTALVSNQQHFITLHNGRMATETATSVADLWTAATADSTVQLIMPIAFAVEA
jgi:hypothetical protein